jgi:hypothetical protein
MTLTIADWERELRAAAGLPVRVVYTRARSRVVWVRRVRIGAPRRVELRLASFFAEAPTPVRAELAAWLRGGLRPRPTAAALRAWIREQLERLPPRPKLSARARGRVHDLGALARGLAVLACGALLPTPAELPVLTWGRATRAGARHALRLGSCDPHARVVRIHPVLDQDAVPEWFVGFVLYHELLHLRHPARPSRGKRLIHHGPEFRRDEERHPDCARARAWERAHLRALMRSTRTGAPMTQGWPETPGTPARGGHGRPAPHGAAQA